tara:strand:+ start:4343 stop:4582 length:240 start_codon:yes stop_codon:yes gene_type:complete
MEKQAINSDTTRTFVFAALVFCLFMQFFREEQNHEQKPFHQSNLQLYAAEWIQPQNREDLSSMDKCFIRYSGLRPLLSG